MKNLIIKLFALAFACCAMTMTGLNRESFANTHGGLNKNYVAESVRKHTKSNLQRPGVFDDFSQTEEQRAHIERTNRRNQAIAQAKALLPAVVACLITITLLWLVAVRIRKRKRQKE